MVFLCIMVYMYGLSLPECIHKSVTTDLSITYVVCSINHSKSQGRMIKNHTRVYVCTFMLSPDLLHSWVKMWSSVSAFYPHGSWASPLALGGAINNKSLILSIVKSNAIDLTQWNQSIVLRKFRTLSSPANPHPVPLGPPKTPSAPQSLVALHRPPKATTQPLLSPELKKIWT